MRNNVVSGSCGLLVCFCALVVATGCGSGSTASNGGNSPGGNTPNFVAATLRSNVPVNTNPAGLAIDPATNSVYVVNSPGYCMNAALGALIKIDGANAKLRFLKDEMHHIATGRRRSGFDHEYGLRISRCKHLPIQW